MIMKRARERDLAFLEEHRDALFTGKNHLVRILRGELKVSRESINHNEPLTEHDWCSLTFGQCISRIAQSKQINLADLAERTGMTRLQVEQIYDDSLTPWDFEPHVILKLGSVLDISNDRMREMIERHRLGPWVLKQRLPTGASAARTHHTLEWKTREEELLQTDLAIQESRENDKRSRFLSELFL